MAFEKKRKRVANSIYGSARKRAIRQLGILQHKGKATFGDDIKITEKEFLGE